MTLETDKQARDRAQSMQSPSMLSRIEFEDEPEVYAAYFFYMRVNTDGMFVAERYFYPGDNTPIGRSTDPTVAGSIGELTQLMALNGRPITPTNPRDPARYPPQGSELDDVRLPRRRAYCVFFMDELHWPFLMDQNNKEPMMTFKIEKNGKKYKDHPYAYTTARVITMRFPADTGGRTREAAVMINRVRDEQGGVLYGTEDFCYDFWMRVHYANNPTRGMTMIIDPSTTNEGPPIPPGLPAELQTVADCEDSKTDA
jgi:hypothetical protein